MTLKRINSLPLLFPRSLFLCPHSSFLRPHLSFLRPHLSSLRSHLSFLRRQESSEQTFLIRSFVVYWIPACAGMTNGGATHSVVSVPSVANI